MNTPTMQYEAEKLAYHRRHYGEDKVTPFPSFDWWLVQRLFEDMVTEYRAVEDKAKE